MDDYADSTMKERKKWIQSLFVSLSENEQRILLGRFCTGERESYDDCSAIVNEVTFDDDHTGSIDVGFTGSTYMGCRDMDIEYDHDAVVLFSIRPDKIIEFTTEPPDDVDRPTDDI